jgi:hypothetical protein
MACAADRRGSGAWFAKQVAGLASAAAGAHLHSSRPPRCMLAWRVPRATAQLCAAALAPRRGFAAGEAGHPGAGRFTLQLGGWQGAPGRSRAFFYRRRRLHGGLVFGDRVKSGLEGAGVAHGDRMEQGRPESRRPVGKSGPGASKVARWSAPALPFPPHCLACSPARSGGFSEERGRPARIVSPIESSGLYRSKHRLRTSSTSSTSASSRDR